jgi:hypothetical protein
MLAGWAGHLPFDIRSFRRRPVNFGLVWFWFETKTKPKPDLNQTIQTKLYTSVPDPSRLGGT